MQPTESLPPTDGRAFSLQDRAMREPLDRLWIRAIAELNFWNMGDSPIREGATLLLQRLAQGMEMHWQTLHHEGRIPSMFDAPTLELDSGGGLRVANDYQITERFDRATQKMAKRLSYPVLIGIDSLKAAAISPHQVRQFREPGTKRVIFEMTAAQYHLLAGGEELDHIVLKTERFERGVTGPSPLHPSQVSVIQYHAQNDEYHYLPYMVRYAKELNMGERTVEQLEQLLADVEEYRREQFGLMMDRYALWRM